MFTLIIIVGALLLLGALGWAGTKVEAAQGTDTKPCLVGPTILFVLGACLLLLWLMGGMAQVPATNIAVVENTLNGEFYVLRPGTHIWPFTSSLVPFVTRVTQYSLRPTVIEIGASPVDQHGVQADSNSPGRPVVLFWGRGWAVPNPGKIVELHRRYGPTWADDWVERNWVSALKAVQGQNGYDYVGNHRVEMQDQVERALQDQLVGEDGETPLVYVTQLAIADYAYSQEVEDYLNQVAQKEFERQQAEQQIEINRKAQEAATIAAETNYIQTKRTAEAEQARLIAEAQGQAEAQRLLADASAYEIEAEAQARANGIRKVQAALSDASPLYIDYLRAMQWNGQLPEYMLGSAPIPFVDVPME